MYFTKNLVNYEMKLSKWKRLVESCKSQWDFTQIIKQIKCRNIAGPYKNHNDLYRSKQVHFQFQSHSRKSHKRSDDQKSISETNY